MVVVVAVQEKYGWILRLMELVIDDRLFAAISRELWLNLIEFFEQAIALISFYSQFEWYLLTSFCAKQLDAYVTESITGLRNTEDLFWFRSSEQCLS